MLALGSACAARAPQRPSAPVGAAPAAVSTRPQLLFAGFRMRPDSLGQPRLAAVQLQTVPGELSGAEPDLVAGADYVVVSLLDAQRRPCGTDARVPHPLRRDAEYVDEKGRLARRTIELPAAEFFVRLARPATAAYLRAEETRGSARRTLLEIPLPPAKP